MTTNEEKIANFILSLQPQKSGGLEAVLASKDLYQSAWLDSLQSLKLLNFLETEYKITVKPFQLLKKNFLSVQSIASFVETLKKQGVQ